MKYFRCHETVLCESDVKHFFTPDDALDFVLNFIVDADEPYGKQYKEMFESDPREDYEKVREDSDALDAFIIKGFEAYGYDNPRLVDLTYEPNPTYRYSKEEVGWLIENFED